MAVQEPALAKIEAPKGPEPRNQEPPRLNNPVAVQDPAFAKIEAPKGPELRGCVDYNFGGISDQLVIAPNPLGQNPLENPERDYTISFWIKTKMQFIGWEDY